MKLRFDSLYLRLTLVLAAALVAGFVTMGWLFHRHMEQDRKQGERHGIAGQVLMVETLLRQYPNADIEAITGHPIFRGAQPPDSEAGPPQALAGGMAAHLSAELGRPLSLRHPQGARGGLWLRLDSREPNWILLLPGDRRGPGGPGGPPGVEPWTWGLLVSFAVVFIGGMALLWRVQVPLRQLEQALDQIRPATAPEPLELRGPGEVKRLAERFNGMMARLHEYEQDREVMLAGVAHDLRAPVTRLRLQMELENSPRRNDMLRNLDSMEAIVDQFLLYARGGEAEAKTEWELNAFIAEVAAPYEAQGVVCQLAGEEDIILAIQASSLRRALCNLIENALEYGAAPVEVGLQQTPAALIISVRDHGQGIAAEDRSRAMRPFTRLDDARARQGHCGLGLAIANRIAESHGGRLSLDNAAEGGLQARIILPR